MVLDCYFSLQMFPNGKVSFISRFGLPDPHLIRAYDMKLKLRMSSVRYTHTNKFQAEMLGFVQHFLQLQDVLGRMRAASAGKKVAMVTYILKK